MAIIDSYKFHLKDKNWLFLSLSGVVLLIVSLVANFYSSKYASISMSNSVSDIILSNIRVYDVDGFFVYGGIAFWLSVFIMALARPNRLPFISKSVALFVLIRAVFISLTHIATFPSHLVIEPSLLFGMFSYYGDLFFSGHTGLPFLMALIFWDNKYLRVIFLASSLFFGVIVLMGHLHYSIDVLGAFFITYSIYHLALNIFKKDKILFDYRMK
jgi:hypothetical protein